MVRAEPYVLALAVACLALRAVGQPIMRTCGDTNMDGARDNYDCSGVANFLAQDPESIACSGNPCEASECCTVECRRWPPVAVTEQLHPCHRLRRRTERGVGPPY